ncbi:MAG: hypothetical protein DRP01_02135 [Archaeoglobales archaeon]|nr:MAG: hypothetical protein DRP01_02135 [Archaeoglobales archaeon]
MIIQPGLEAPSVANMIELIRKDSLRRVNIELQDETGAVIDIDKTTGPGGDPNGELELQVTTAGGHVIYTESFWPPPLIAEPRIKKAATGKYYIKWGTGALETAYTGTIVFNWHSRQNATSEDAYRSQIAEVVSPRILTLFPSLRLLLDKTVKPNLPEKYCFIGYTDGMLGIFLKMGLHYINSFQPYPCWTSLDYFPIEDYSTILLKAAMYQAITSQLLFAIDTDVPNFSDSGRSFVLQHAQPLAAYLQNLKQELEGTIPNFKRHFVNSGTVSIEARLDLAFGMLLATSPPGNLFRNLWSST